MKLVNDIKFEVINKAYKVDESQQSISKSKNYKNSESDNKSTLIHKIVNIDRKFYDIYIKSKYTKIILWL